VQTDEETTTLYTVALEELARKAISWSTDEEWVVELQHPLPQPMRVWTTEETEFWPTYMWTDNPGVTDHSGGMLTSRKYDRILPCTIAELNVQRTGVRTYAMTIPFTGKRGHCQTKLRQWAIAILSGAPRMEIGASLQTGTTVRMRHQPQLENDYTWESHEPGRIIGTQVSRNSTEPETIRLEQQPDGLHWQVQRSSGSDELRTEDSRKLQRKARGGGIVFQAHPTLHSFHWEVPDTTANKHVGVVIKKQAFRRYKGQGIELGKIVKKLQAAANDSSWQAASMQQTPKQLWAHKHELSAYQVWVGYRVAVRQLNLFHEDRLLDKS
jgi:hypothetical protein